MISGLQDDGACAVLCAPRTVQQDLKRFRLEEHVLDLMAGQHVGSSLRNQSVSFDIATEVAVKHGTDMKLLVACVRQRPNVIESSEHLVAAGHPRGSDSGRLRHRLRKTAPALATVGPLRCRRTAAG